MISLDHAIKLMEFGMADGIVPAADDVPDEVFYTSMPPSAMRRQAAQAFLRLAQDRPATYPTFVLNVIHQALADPSAEIRLTLVAALYHAGDRSSIQPLHDLIAVETERLAAEPTPRSLSSSIIAYARAAAVRCDPPDYDRLTHCDHPIITILTDDLEIAGRVTAVAEELQALIHYLVSPDELFWVPSAIQLIDRTCMRDGDTWRCYIEQLNDDARAGFADATPLILIEAEPTLAPAGLPTKAPRRLLAISHPDLIVAAIRHFLVQHRPRPMRR